MLVTKGDIIESKQVNRGSWSWVKVPDLDRLYTTLINEGFVHHASLIHGDYANLSRTPAKQWVLKLSPFNYIGINTIVFYTI